MEGLQDAIQDAQYMGEMCDDTPLPMTRLELPLRGDVDNYRDELKNQKPQDQGRRTYDLAAFGVRALLTINWQIMLWLGFVSIRKRY